MGECYGYIASPPTTQHGKAFLKTLCCEKKEAIFEKGFLSFFSPLYLYVFYLKKFPNLFSVFSNLVL